MPEQTVVTVGSFDGVHLGHREVLARLVRRGEELGCASLLVSFDPHPLALVRPDAGPMLLTPGPERLEALAATGVHRVAILPFTASLARYSAEQFVDLVLRERFGMRELLIGHDHGFGRGRHGDVTVLQALGRARGFRVEVVPAVASATGEPISSTMVRRMVAAGDLDGVAAALGRPYAMSGRVVAGEGRGRALGFPTLNIELDSTRKLLPPEGVYAVVAETRRGRFGGMMNLGPRPTFGDARRSLEVHLFDAEGAFYGEHVRVVFVARLRDVLRFPSPQALVEQLPRDAADARRALTEVL
jgi:riboflavin kinase/FMN adenylyltransferase